jgi:2-polyprenyl-6-hydroxyphenyl methylase/3-demethylubiquinone-9 3-methyltransferase
MGEKNTNVMNTNVDPAELEKFSELAHRWWDPESEFKPLHEINPLRLAYINEIAELQGKLALDVGCGGGILAEAMAACGAQVTGIDLADKPLQVARLHLLESGLKVNYRKIAVEELARESPRSFDVVTCMEMLEHVPDPAATVRACADLLKPGGHAFFATLNRNPKSYLYAIIGAEYVLKLLPRGTHDYARFIKPSELAAACRSAGLDVTATIGMTYNPFSKTYALEADTDVNYILCARGPQS